MRKQLLLIMFIALYSLGFGQTKNFIDQPYLEIQVTTDAEVERDTTYLTVRLKEADERNNTSTKTSEENKAEVLEILKGNVDKLFLEEKKEYAVVEDLL